MLQFKLPATQSVHVPAGDAQGVARSVHLGRAAIFGHEEDDGLQDSPWAGCPCGEGGDGCEKSKSKLHTCMEAKAFEEI
jgi:hypothetical protein